MAALAAARAALLAGDLDTLAISINGNLEALLDPARGYAGTLDVEDVNAALVEIYQSATVEEVLAALVPRT
jgi:hypothetical protein